MDSARKLLQIHPRDNVAVASEPVAAGEIVRTHSAEVTAVEPIPSGHKAALTAIPSGASVIKYGFPIGSASCAIEPGMWVHVHNVQTNLAGVLDYSYEPELQGLAAIHDDAVFDGFVRPDGDVGVRNEIWIVPTIGCVNEIAKALAREMSEQTIAGVDGVFAWTHPHGCTPPGADFETTQKVLAGLVRHPNAAGVLVLGLGCENNTVGRFRGFLGEADPDRVKFLVCQQVENEMEAGTALLRELCDHAAQCRRETIPVSRLRIGLKCGGSDGFSGITGNPLVGVFSDMLVARGGTTVLTEVPEMFGAETLLMNRCVDRGVFDKCVKMINDFKEYFLRYGREIYENPSLGNKDGGLTTLEEKSLGCVQKGGTAPVVDVVEYGGRLENRGLNLLSGPGNDMVAVTALAAAGAHVILFTTGRGTPLGAPVPTIKISTNSALAARKSNWIDFDAGVLTEGAPMLETAEQLFQSVLDIASGRTLARHEENGFREIVIFRDGVTV